MPTTTTKPQTMRVNVTLDEEQIGHLTKVMADMPGTDGDGRPVGVSPADALRHALKVAAKGRK